MSLNGLDAADIHDAYEAALLEAGGWLLLNYISRDSVALLGRGRNGVHEARAAIAQYKEVSPLYGMIVYRRRKVVIKYIPEGTSRLLQARTTVHFQDVTERFAPYETVIDIAFADDLNDTALADSFPLYSATPSIPPNRLEEISEDAEEAGAPLEQTMTENTHSGIGIGIQHNGMDRYQGSRASAERPSQDRGSLDRPSTDRSERQLPSTPDSSTRSRSPSKRSPTKSSVSRFMEHGLLERSSSLRGPPSTISLSELAVTASTVTNTETARSVTDASPDKTLPSEPSQFGQDSWASQSSFSTKSNEPTFTTDRYLENLSAGPKLSGDYDPFDYSKFEVQPKVKLGPRPVADRTKRSGMSGGIASVPAGYRPNSKRQELVRPASLDPPNKPLPAAPVQSPTRSIPAPSPAPTSTSTLGADSAPAPSPVVAPSEVASTPVSASSPALAFIPAPPPVPETAPQQIPRPVSRGSNKTGSQKSSAMTAEKLRLMKAVELRRRQLRKSKEESKEESRSTTPQDQPQLDSSVAPSSPHTTVSDSQRELEPGQESFLTDSFVDALEGPAAAKADSGVGMNYIQQAQAQSITSIRTPKLGYGDSDSKPVPSAPETTETTPAENYTLGATAEQSLDHALALRVVSNDPLTPNKQGQFMVDSPTLGLHNGGVSDSIASMLPPTSSTKPSVPHPITEEHDENDDSQPTTPTESMSRPVTAPEEQMTEEPQGLGVSSPDISFHSHSRSLEGIEVAKRRRGMIDPLQLESPKKTDGEFEHQTQPEPKAMLTSISPVTEEFHRRPSVDSGISKDSAPPSPVSPMSKLSAVSGTVSPESQSRVDLAIDTPPAKISHAERSLPLERTRTDSIERADHMVGRKVSAGISQRIRNLAEQSSREGSPHPSMNNRPLNQPSISSFSERARKRATRNPPGGPRTDASSQLNKTNNRPPLNRQKSSDTATVMSMNHDPISKRDSVSVSARIVRPQHQHSYSVQSDGGLQQAQLVFNHKRASTSNGLGAYDQESVPGSPPPADRGHRGSFASLSQTLNRASKDFRNTEIINGSLFKLRKPSLSPIGDDQPSPLLSPDLISSQTSFMNWNDGDSVPKEGSRTSRFFKRISSLGSSKRMSKSAAGRSPSALSFNSDGMSVATHSGFMNIAEKSETPPAVVIGNLNVQFPDSLLWKHRIARIDENGFLIFTDYQALDIQKGVSKKYHLSDFKLPYTPDLDRQELPHSVMFDFHDGSTLQTACEDGMTHRLVLQTFRLYWKAWSVTP